MKIVFFTHSIVSDWSHGNAHFLRGLIRALHGRGHDVVACERAGRVRHGTGKVSADGSENSGFWAPKCPAPLKSTADLPRKLALYLTLPYNKSHRVRPKGSAPAAIETRQTRQQVRKQRK